MIKTAIAVITGCTLALQLSTLPSFNLLWWGLFNVFLLFFKQTRLIAFCLGAALWTLHYATTQLNHSFTPDTINQTITLSGTIATIPVQQGHAQKFDFKVDEKPMQPFPDKFRLNWYRPFPNDLMAGQRWQLTVKLKPPRGMHNPGGFDFEGYLFQQGINATGYVRQSPDNTLLSPPSDYHLNALRQRYADHLQQHFEDSPQLGLILGLTTGLRDQMSDSQWQILQNTGTSHLLAISGLHIGIAAALGFFSLRFLWSIRANNTLIWPAKQVGAIGAIATAAFYAAMAGFSIPTQRALLMVMILMLAQLIRKPITNSQLLAIAAIIIVIIDPLSVLSAGFWLSFTAVALILWLGQHRHPKPRFGTIRIHTALALGLTPLLLLFFSKTAWSAPVANLIAIPFVSLLIIPLLLIATLLIPLSESASLTCFELADQGLAILIAGLQLIADNSLSHSHFALSQSWMVIPLSIMVILLLGPKGLPAKHLVVFALLPLLPFSKPDLAKGDMHLTLLDVGQGLSAVVQPQNHRLIFDTGARFSPQFDAGKIAILPFLEHHNINHIDTLVLSHDDNDHSGAAPTLINQLTIDTIMGNPNITLPQVQRCYAGQHWQWDEVTFEFLSPTLGQKGSDNNLSCVLKVSNADHQILLTGDIERQTEYKLLKTQRDKLKSTLLIAPHHGSNSSSTSAFIEAVSPQTVLFPVGYLNRYHFPSDKVIQRYQERQIKQYSTADHGALLVSLKQGQDQQITAWRQATHKIWHSRPTD